MSKQPTPPKALAEPLIQARLKRFIDEASEHQTDARTQARLKGLIELVNSPWPVTLRPNDAPVVKWEAETQGAPTKGQRQAKRRKRKPGGPRAVTEREREALNLRNQERLSYEQLGKRLGIHKSAAWKLVKNAERKDRDITKAHGGGGRSVKATRRLPEDRRGQVSVQDDRDADDV